MHFVDQVPTITKSVTNVDIIKTRNRKIIELNLFKLTFGTRFGYICFHKQILI
jgi:hypothetical protein